MSKGLPRPETRGGQQRIHRSTDLREAQRLLAKIEPEDYNVWFEVGCALKGMGADYKMFCDWSARSEKFDADECREKWDQLPDEPRAGLTTLRNLADGVDVCRAKAEATGKKKDRIVSSTSDTVPHTQPINQSTEGGVRSHSHCAFCFPTSTRGNAAASVFRDGTDQTSRMADNPAIQSR